MTYYELFQLGPAVYIPALLISFGITLLAYSAFPLIFAKTRKKVITTKKYNLLCYGVNFLVMILFIVFNGESSGSPYLLWTCAFSIMGVKILKNRGVLEGFQKKGHGESDFIMEINSKDKIQFCRKCGSKLLDGASFCNKCGTEVIEEAENKMLKCDKCNHRSPHDSEFCQYCGSKIRKATIDDFYSEAKQAMPTKGILDSTMATAFEKDLPQREKIKYCSRCGYLIDNQTKQCTGCRKQYFKGFRLNKFSYIILSFSLVLLVAIGFIIYQRGEINSLETDVQILLWQKNNLENDLYNYEDLVNFVDDHVVFIEDDGSKLYHKYDCYKFKGESFWVFNIEFAEGKGFSKCSTCH